MVQILKHQAEFLNSRATHTGLVAGYGSGKSISATIKTIERKKEYPEVNCAYYLPTYSLIKSIAYPNFIEYLEKCGVSYQLNKADAEINTSIGKIIFRSMERPETIIGYEVGYSLIDEADVINKNKMVDIFSKIISRNRKPLLDESINSTDLVSTPEGFNFMYDFFIKKPSKNKKLIKAKTLDNPFLPKGYVDTLKEQFTDKQLSSYINGEFVNLTSGSVYNYFDRERHVKEIELKDGEPLHVGLDFNVGNMSAVIHVQRGKELYAVDEVVNFYDTRSISQEVRDRYPKRLINVYPDASGGARSTSGESDHDILKEYGFRLRTRKANPRVKDRVSHKNNMYAKNLYFISINCKEYIEAQEKQAYKNGVPDKTSGFDHINEAGDYCSYSMQKIGRPTVVKTNTFRTT